MAKGTFTQFLGQVGTWAFLVAAWLFIGSMLYVAHKDGMQQLRKLVQPTCEVCGQPVHARTDQTVAHGSCLGLKDPWEA